MMTTTPLVAMRCEKHGTFRAPAGEGCPACPKVEPVPQPAPADDFPAED